MANIRNKCDFCNDAAEYDCKTIMGPWAYCCEEHYKLYGSKTPGLFTKLKKDEAAATKQCRICGKTLPVSSFYKYTDNTGVERYRTECIECNLRRRSKSAQH